MSTLEILFQNGLRDFEGLKIRDLWEDRTYPVVHPDFSLVKNFSSLKDFVRQFQQIIEIAFRDVGFQKSGPQIGILAQLTGWLNSLAPCSLVVLIDEYDAPLTACLNQQTLFEAVRDELSRFYSVLKSKDNCLRFWFMTGITKFSSTSIFSDLNNFTDISLDPKCGTLLGYTEKEISEYFSDYLKEACLTLKISQEQLMDELRAHYNGFCFDEKAQTTVYCPWSVLNFLNSPSRGFQDYWYAGRAP